MLGDNMELSNAQKNSIIILLRFEHTPQEISDKLNLPIELIKELQNKQLIIDKNENDPDGLSILRIWK